MRLPIMSLFVHSALRVAAKQRHAPYNTDMPSQAPTIDDIMDRASEALARMDYLACEQDCLSALAVAREAHDWANYARILLPLQESRRQRRMIAAEGAFRFGTAEAVDDAPALLLGHDAVSIVITLPNDAELARQAGAFARRNRRYVEVLFADCAVDAPTWTLRSVAGPAVSCSMPAPPTDWLDVWIDCTGRRFESTDESPMPVKGARQPADWFLEACERLGDAALATVPDGGDATQRIAALEQCLDVVTDHEILHQRLGDAARAAQLGVS